MLRVVVGAAAARATVLKRVPFEQAQVPLTLERSLERVFGRPLTPQEAVDEIIREVADKGDAALLRYSELIDGVSLQNLEVGQEAIESAYCSVPEPLRKALQLAAQRIRAFHEKQPVTSWLDWRSDGALGQVIRPLGRVGIYVPGGTAPLASSLLMTAMPARVAGVEEIIVCTPPQRDTGLPHQVVLAAAHVADIRSVFAVGGAQAIAAMAFGTETIPRVDKVVGPGNIFVVLAKKALFGMVGIESLPGPTETLIIADEGADPALVAADMLAQAEHVLASAILLTPSETLAEKVRSEIERRLRDDIGAHTARESFANRGGIGICRDMDEALLLANEYAPEHLCLLVADPWALVPRVRNAGGIFVGECASEALGDYVVGPSHVMPTGGTARFASPVNVWDFVKITSIFAPGPSEVADISDAGAMLAEAEGLTAHRQAILLRGGSTPER
ncbi:MAG: histidinol dehydrogenase [Anaerolineae bacterium]